MLSGLLDMPWWGYVLATLAMTHVTIASVTIYLHRHQAHRALDLHPAMAHFFRFWLWLTTGTITEQWVAVHRKHHACVESEEDPHSPKIFGIRKVLLEGVELYRIGARDPEDDRQIQPRMPGRLARAQRLQAVHEPRVLPHAAHRRDPVRTCRHHDLGGTDALDPRPRGWRHQRRRPLVGLPELRDAGHLHEHRPLGDPHRRRRAAQQHHHAFASSAKLSSKPWEFDIGWAYIRGLEFLRLARVKKLPPEVVMVPGKIDPDVETIQAVISNRFHVMADYARRVLSRVHAEEIAKNRLEPARPPDVGALASHPRGVTAEPRGETAPGAGSLLTATPSIPSTGTSTNSRRCGSSAMRPMNTWWKRCASGAGRRRRAACEPSRSSPGHCRRIRCVRGTLLPDLTPRPFAGPVRKSRPMGGFFALGAFAT